MESFMSPAGKDSRFTLFVLYGSQTGTAQDLAVRVGRLGSLNNLNTKVMCLDDFPIVNILSDNPILFIVSTTGQGEEPDNMKMFWKYLMKKSLPKCLAHLRFGVIGLGDSSFEKYNVVAKKLFKRLQILGGQPLHPLILGDDQHELGPDATIDPGLKTFWKSLCTEYNLLPVETDAAMHSLPQPSFKVKILRNGERDILDTEKDRINKSNDFLTVEAHLTKNERLTGLTHFQDVRLLEFQVRSPSNFEYLPGSVAVIKPENLEESIEEFFKITNVAQPNDQLEILPLNVDGCPPAILKTLPRKCPFKHIVATCWDLNFIPKRSFFELFHHFSQSDLEKEKLQEFSTIEGQEELWDYTLRPRRTVLEVLKDFPHTTPYVPLDYWFELLPPIQPRSFSIASSPKMHPQAFHLLVAVVSYKTIMAAPRKGLCSTWLSRLAPGTVLSVKIKPTCFTLPLDHIPSIMVGPGTGCAPFRALIQDRISKGIGQNILFFGSRNQQQDFFFADEWQIYQDKKLLTLFTAFSRDQFQKIYVQHRLIEQKDLIWDLISNQGAFFYIAGNAKQMPQDVRKALLSIFQEKGLSEQNAESFLKDLQSKRRFQLEVW